MNRKQNRKIIAASKNAGKLREFKEIFKELPIDILSLKDMPFDCKLPDEGEDYIQNASGKAETVAKTYNIPAIADDSGIEVDYLNGKPGPLSARFGGENLSDRERNMLLLKKLNGIPKEKRTARFRCVIALAIPGSKTKTVEAACEGIISETISGEEGFGYDPVFYVHSLGKTFAEMSSEEKNKISHRGKALQKIKRLIEDFINN